MIQVHTTFGRSTRRIHPDESYCPAHLRFPNIHHLLSLSTNTPPHCCRIMSNYLQQCHEGARKAYEDGSTCPSRVFSGAVANHYIIFLDFPESDGHGGDL